MAQQLSDTRAFLDGLYGDDDILEIRLLGDVEKHLYPKTYFAPKANWSKPDGTLGYQYIKKTQSYDPVSVGHGALRAWNDSGYNVYIGVNPRREQEKLRGDAESVAAIVSAYADIDGVKPSDCLDALKARGIRASMIVQSNDQIFGAHVYLKLANAVPVPEGPDGAAVRSKWEDINRRLISIFTARGWKADAVQDVPRILRIPGMVNVPDARKREAGRIDSRCSLAHIDAGATYTFEDLDRLLPRLEATESSSKPEDSNARPWFELAEDQRRVQAEKVWQHRIDEKGAGYFDHRSPRGQRNLADMRLLSNDFALPIPTALSMIEAKGASIDNDAAAWSNALSTCKSSLGSMVWDRPGSADSARAGNEPAPVRPTYVPPSPEEVLDAIAGSPMEVYLHEVKKIDPHIAGEMILLDSLLLAGMTLANREVRVGLARDDYDPTALNIYAMKLAPPSKGKGLSSRFLLRCAESMSFPRLHGESESAIIACAESGARYGLYYKDEIRKILDPTSVTARQIVNTLLSGWDEGQANYFTRPGGEAKSISVKPFYPSVLIDGQPNVFEESLGKNLFDSGFLARFLIASPVTSHKVRKKGTPCFGAIDEAYKPFKHAAAGIVLCDDYQPDCAAERYSEHMTEEEQFAWGRLSGQYATKLALMLDPAALTTGKISKRAFDRAGVVCSYYFGNSIKILGLIHADRDEMLRSRCARAIQDNSGCDDRYLYNRLKCSCATFRKDIAPTLIARGDAHTKDGQWIAGAGASDRFTFDAKREGKK